jgi:hypothetical protein
MSSTLQCVYPAAYEHPNSVPDARTNSGSNGQSHSNADPKPDREPNCDAHHLAIGLAIGITNGLTDDITNQLTHSDLPLLRSGSVGMCAALYHAPMCYCIQCSVPGPLRHVHRTAD